MSETTVAAPKKKGGGGKAKKSASANHPKVAEMVSEAISTLKERNGSSLQAIKKYISTEFNVEVEKLAPFIRRYLKSSVVNGTLIQTKGKGASGSFKLGGKAEGGHAVAKTGPTKRNKRAAPKKPAVVATKPMKRTSQPKKTAKPKAAKKASKVKAKRSPMKAKTPKPKKAASKAAKGKASSAPKQTTAA